jgi:hypothetical protein
MDQPDDNRGRTPRDRFRNILSADKDGELAPEARKPAVVNLPRASPRADEEWTTSEGRPDVSQPARGAMSAPKWLPTFWTVGGILSIVANFILLIMLFSTWRGLSAFGTGGANGGALLSAYSSLEQLDQAHIRASIPVQTNIALDATVPVTSSTTITLAQDVYMEGAHVTINTALFNIDAPANITLPAGTSLDVALDMTLPLQTSVPITMDVPVDIAVRDTDLHAAIQGMKDALKPLLCAASPGATLPDGSAICR